MGNYDDWIIEMFTELDEKGLRDKFYKQLDKMKWQDKHKYKDTRARFDYAYQKVTGSSTLNKE